MFGSGTKGFKDEFSDIDVWITFKDSDIEKILNKLAPVFESIAPVIIKHHSKSWSPVGGSSNSIIHEVNNDLFVVDYYISKLSETELKTDSKLVFGSEKGIKKGEWKLNKHLEKPESSKKKKSHSLRKYIDLYLDLIFISYKGIVRGWEDDGFVNTLKLVHKDFDEKYPEKLKRRVIKLSFKSNARLLSDLYKVANKRQRKAIYKIRKFAYRIEKLYFS